MHGRQLHTALGHHIGGHRRINAAGDHDGCLAAGAHRHAAGARQLPGVQIRTEIADLHRDLQIRLVDIHLQMRKMLQHIAAYLPADLRRGQGKLLIRSLGFHLEGGTVLQGIAKILHRRLLDRLQRFFGHTRPRKGGNAKHPRNTIAGFVQIRCSILRLNIDRGLCAAHGKLPRAAQTVSQIAHQRLFKGSAIKPLKRQFAVFDQQDLLRMVSCRYHRFSSSLSQLY